MDLIGLQNRALEQGIGVQLLVGECIQLAFLDGLYRDKRSLPIHFQGGTSIRLLHQGWRYSEDLDFACGSTLPADLNDLVVKAAKHTQAVLNQWWGQASLEFHLQEKPGRQGMKTFWIKLKMPGEPKLYRVKLEFAPYPVYQAQAWPTRRAESGLSVLPLVLSESLSELLADKITAFAGRPYIKGRDIFDIWFLTTVLHVHPDIVLLHKKWRDYHIADARQAIQKNLSLITARQLSDEMDRFLPEPERTRLAANGYGMLLEALHACMDKVLPPPVS